LRNVLYHTFAPLVLCHRRGDPLLQLSKPLISKTAHLVS